MAQAPPEKVEFVRPPALPGIEIIRVDNCSRLFSVFHTAYEVCTVLPKPAFSEWRYRGKTHEAGSRGTSFMEPGELHHNTSVRGVGDFRVLVISPLAMSAFSRAHGGPDTPHFACTQTWNAGIYRKFARLHELLEEEVPPLESQSRLAECMGLLLEQCIEGGLTQTTTDASEAIRRARDLLIDHYRESVTLDQLSEAARLSPYHLIRAFKKKTGLSPHAFQVQLRIARARELLRKRLPIVQVAQVVGFYDQSHFTRYFKRAWGITPAEYLRGQAAGPG